MSEYDVEFGNVITPQGEVRPLEETFKHVRMTQKGAGAQRSGGVVSVQATQIHKADTT
jgi:hypothetical protein